MRLLLMLLWTPKLAGVKFNLSIQKEQGKKGDEVASIYLSHLSFWNLFFYVCLIYPSLSSAII